MGFMHVLLAGQRLQMILGVRFCRALDRGLSARAAGEDCQDFRVWAGIMGKKESHYVPTQRTYNTE